MSLKLWNPESDWFSKTIEKFKTAFEVIKIILDLGALVTVVVHLQPENKVEAWGKTGSALIVMLAIFWTVLLIINFLLSLIIQSREIELSKTREELKINSDKHKIDVDLIRNGFETERGEWNKSRVLLEREAKYKQVFSMLNQGFGEIHRAEDKESYERGFTEFCNIVKNVFSHITSLECHVCIKLCIVDEKEHMKFPIRVETIARSTSGTAKRREIDSKKEIKHWVDYNTDFKKCFSDSSSFFSNNLCAISGETYMNTSLLHKRDSHIYYDSSVSIEHREKEWPLDYRASIVTPIIPSIRNKENPIYALICLDAPTANAFDETTDKEILEGCAEGIYNDFRQYFDKFLSK